jgi:hypothetical protein
MSTDTDLRIARLVLDERQRQDARWGEPKDLPNGTGPDKLILADLPYAKTPYPLPEHLGKWTATELADSAKANCDIATEQGKVTYADILIEEHFEALAESDPEKLFDELVQVAAVAQKWCRALIEHQGVQR